MPYYIARWNGRSRHDGKRLISAGSASRAADELAEHLTALYPEGSREEIMVTMKLVTETDRIDLGDRFTKLGFGTKPLPV
jgi:hypothetical protein